MSHEIGLGELQNYDIEGRNIDLIAWLKNIKGMGRIYVHEPKNMYHVFSSDGESRIVRKFVKNRPYYSYEIVSGKDPLFYANSKDCDHMIDAGFHGREEWIQYRYKGYKYIEDNPLT